MSERTLALIAAVSALFAAGCRTTTTESVEADICIYGGTSAGVAAALQASRMGKSVVIVEPGSHLGGMTAGGLGATDIGDKSAIGGISREFYRRLGKHYGQPEAWRFEPSVAEKTFQEMVREADARIFFLERLDGVRLDGTRIAAIETVPCGSRAAGRPRKRYAARVFLDATYEGDLLAGAGVTYAVGREANSKYGETLNGIRPETPYHQFTVPVDPYVKPGVPSSGLLPFIQPGDGGVPGEGDSRIQAYNFRLCITQVSENRKAIEPSATYDPARYELLARYLEALVASGETPRLDDFLSIIEMPNGKTDVNNKGGFSTDFIGGNYDYPEGSYEVRERIRQEHEDYTRGFLCFLATSPRVPEGLRKEMQSWGLAEDEFVETGGWPHQLYIREARRMVSDYVMTEHNCRGSATVDDPIGMGAYNMDSHNCQRIVRDGLVQNEGDVQVRSVPYSISYRSIVPRTGECENLLVPVCVSASHIAYGSIRMEPVFMILGQSAATAAAIAIDDGVAVQAVDRGKLRNALEAGAQILTLDARGRP